MYWTHRRCTDWETGDCNNVWRGNSCIYRDKRTDVYITHAWGNRINPGKGILRLIRDKVLLGRKTSAKCQINFLGWEIDLGRQINGTFWPMAWRIGTEIRIQWHFSWKDLDHWSSGSVPDVLPSYMNREGTTEPHSDVVFQLHYILQDRGPANKQHT